MAIYQWNIDDDHLTLSLVGQARRGDFVLRSQDLIQDIDLDQWTESELESFVSSFQTVTMRRVSQGSAVLEREAAHS